MDRSFPSIPGYQTEVKETLAIYVDDHCIAHEDFESYSKFLHEEYFPRAVFAPIPFFAGYVAHSKLLTEARCSMAEYADRLGTRDSFSRRHCRRP